MWPRQTSIRCHCSAIIHTLSTSSRALTNKPKQKSGRAITLPAPALPRSLSLPMDSPKARKQVKLGMLQFLIDVKLWKAVSKTTKHLQERNQNPD